MRGGCGTVRGGCGTVRGGCGNNKAHCSFSKVSSHCKVSVFHFMLSLNNLSVRGSTVFGSLPLGPPINVVNVEHSPLCILSLLPPRG